MSDQETNTIHTGDCFDALDDLPSESIHACVSDPPYGLAFMGRDWDDFEPKEYQQWCEEWARKVKRVLKPGAHLLAFSGNRTHHRLFTGVEDAGFEIRDTLTWHYGSGFPKASDISKTIDKREGAERKVIGKYHNPDGTTRDYDNYDNEVVPYHADAVDEYDERQLTQPATDAAKKWDGWKTGLKPATEFVVMARKPFDGATVDCVQEHGTGALNIDGCRVGSEERENPPTSHNDACYSDAGDRPTEQVSGRYPANVVFGETEAERLDAKNDTTVSSGGATSHPFGETDKYGEGDDGFTETEPGKGDVGGPSRYFYTSKASKSERTENGSIENAHPTVKPQDLMEWLVKLVTREGQIVIDPFAGSGTTCKAAKSLNRQFIGIEKQAQWADVARVRAGLTPHDPSNVRENDAQQGLESFGVNKES